MSLSPAIAASTAAVASPVTLLTWLCPTACPRCRHRAGRYAVGTRTLHDLGDARANRPIDLVVTFSRHRCLHCGCCFACDIADLALPYCLYTRRVQQLAVCLVAEDGL